MASCCIHTQDLALFWMDGEVEILRKRWDNCIAANAALEGKVLGLERNLTAMNQRNRHLQHKVDTAHVTRSERDSLRIATLEARVVRMEEELKARDKVIEEKASPPAAHPCLNPPPSAALPPPARPPRAGAAPAVPQPSPPAALPHRSDLPTRRLPQRRLSPLHRRPLPRCASALLTGGLFSPRWPRRALAPTVREDGAQRNGSGLGWSARFGRTISTRIW